MGNGSSLISIIALVLTAALPGSGVTAEGGRAGDRLTAPQLIGLVDLSSAQRRALDRAEIVTLGLPELEESPRELVALLMVRVSGSLREVAGFIHANNTFGLAETTDVRVAAMDGGLGQALRQVVRLDGESAEIERLMSVGPGDSLNLSRMEIEAFQDTAERLRRASADQTREAEALAETYRELLTARYRAYRRQGLEGITPYLRADGKLVDPGRELRIATESVDVLEREFPKMYGVLLQFPKRDLERLRHRYFVLRKMVRQRPAFVLSHWLMDIRDDYALLVERQYYVGHTYNSLQVGILCLPYRGGTLVALLNQTFTGRVTGLFSGLRHGVGRQRIQDTIRPLFRALRSEFREQ